MKTTGFHADLRAGLTATGLTASQASLKSGLYWTAIPRYIRERTYPLPDAFPRIAHALGLPLRIAAAWRREALRARPRHERAFQRRAAVRGVTKQPARMCALPSCGKLFLPLDPNSQYHNRKCFYQHRRQLGENANGLQRAFAAELNRRGLTLKVAATTLGYGYSALRAWLNRPNSRLRDPSPIADFLGISIEEAIRQQGGTDAARRAEIARKFAIPSAHRWQRNKRNRRRARESLAKAQAVRRGRPMSEEHKQKIRDALLAYRAKPDAHPLGVHHSSPRGWVQQHLRSLKALHPELPQHRLEKLCLRKLMAMGKPFAGRDMQVAKALISRSQRIRKTAGRPVLRDRDTQIFRMRRQGALWVEITKSVNVREKTNFSTEYLKVYYR